jgi:hypothetical protein
MANSIPGFGFFMLMGAPDELRRMIVPMTMSASVIDARLITIFIAHRLNATACSIHRHDRLDALASECAKLPAEKSPPAGSADFQTTKPPLQMTKSETDSRRDWFGTSAWWEVVRSLVSDALKICWGIQWKFTAFGKATG